MPAAMTFMLAAPIVNPIVIASTLYAFPGQSNIAIDSVYIGITIAFAVGLTFLFSLKKKLFCLMKHEMFHVVADTVVKELGAKKILLESLNPYSNMQKLNFLMLESFLLLEHFFLV